MSTREVLAVLGDPTRFEVLNRLASGGPASASSLAHELPVSRQAISKHLAALEEVGLLERERSGREVRYVFQPDALDGVAVWITRMGSTWDERLARLKDTLD